MQEVEAVCNRVIIINKGRIVADAPTGELQLLTRSNRIISLEFLQKYDFNLLKSIPDIVDIQQSGEKSIKVFTQGQDDRRADIFRFAVDRGWIILGMGYEDQSIEQVFRQLTFEK
jgi:ABC-2 type transport system ATP-binding protein